MEKEHPKHISLVQLLMKSRLQTVYFIVWFSLILIVSVIPDHSPDTLKINIYELRLDYIKHFFVYLPLGFFLLSLQKKGIVLSLVLGILVISIPEIAQYYIPYRAFNPIDLLSNAVGLLAGIVIYNFFNRKFNTQK